jgi:hypothetical protein
MEALATVDYVILISPGFVRMLTTKLVILSAVAKLLHNRIRCEECFSNGGSDDEIRIRFPLF